MGEDIPAIDSQKAPEIDRKSRQPDHGADGHPGPDVSEETTELSVHHVEGNHSQKESVECVNREQKCIKPQGPTAGADVHEVCQDIRRVRKEQKPQESK